MGEIRSRRFLEWVVAIIIFGGLGTGAGCQQAPQEGKTEKSGKDKQTATATISSQPLKTVEDSGGQRVDLATAIIQVATSNIPAVVHIEVTERQEVPNPFLPFEKDPSFRRYFDLPKKMPKKFERELIGIGTGMIIDSQGHILTNNHVVGGASKIQVTLSNGDQYQARVVGTDPKTDLGVIEIASKAALPCVKFADSDKVQVGQWVVAIGHPRGLNQSVTQGIISAKHRGGILDPSGYQDFLQTDAAINPGNSGGPLLTLGGEVIGVNSVIVSESGGFEGIGFSIPSNMAVHVANVLIKYGKVERGWLGVSVQDITHDLAKSFGLETPRGALINDITKNGPAEKAGIKRGDIVLAYQGKDVPDATGLRNSVANTPVGEEVTVTLWRDRKKQELRVKVGNLEDLTKILAASLKERLGAKVRPVTVQDAQQYGIGAPRGVVIQWIDPKGPLGKAGFEVGDIILEINGQSIVGIEGLADLVSSSTHGQKIALLALDHRNGQTANVQVEMQ